MSVISHVPNPFPARIVADNLIIERWSPTDAHDMEALIVANLDHLRPWMAWVNDEPLGRAQRLRLFERWDQYWASGQGAVYSLRLDEQLVGGCALHRRPAAVAEIGYWLGRAVVGRGVAGRATVALIDAAFDDADIELVRISHSASNKRSGAIPQRLGFHLQLTGASHAATVWTITRRQWADR